MKQKYLKVSAQFTENGMMTPTYYLDPEKDDELHIIKQIVECRRIGNDIRYTCICEGEYEFVDLYYNSYRWFKWERIA